MFTHTPPFTPTPSFPFACQVAPIPSSSDAALCVTTIPQKAIDASHVAGIAQARASAIEDLRAAAVRASEGRRGGVEIGTPASMALGVPSDALPGLTGALEAVTSHCGMPAAAAAHKGGPPTGLSAGASIDGPTPPEDISFAARRALRVARRSSLRALAGWRPSASAEYSPDAEAVSWAQAHVGDFSLKMSKDYIPPPFVRIDSATKRRQVLLVEGHLHGTTSDYNARVLTLRESRDLVLTALLAAEEEANAITEELTDGITVRTLARAEVDIHAARLTPPSVADAAASFTVPPAVLAEARALAANGRKGEGVGGGSLVALAAQHTADALAEAAYERAYLQHTQRQRLTREASAVITAKSPPPFEFVPEGDGVQTPVEKPLRVPSPPAAAATDVATPPPFVYHGPTTAFLRTLSATSARGLESTRNNSSSSSSSSSYYTQHASAASNSSFTHSSLDAARAALLIPVDPHAATLDPYSMLRTPSAMGGGGGGVFNPSTFSLQAVCLSPYGALTPRVPHAFIPMTSPSLEEAEAAAAAYTSLCDRRVALRARQMGLLSAYASAHAALRAERSAVLVEISMGRVRLHQLHAELRLLSDLASKDAALEARGARARSDKAAHALVVASAQVRCVTR